MLSRLDDNVPYKAYEVMSLLWLLRANIWSVIWKPSLHFQIEIAGKSSLPGESHSQKRWHPVTFHAPLHHSSLSMFLSS